jgi:hypothetical protein
LIKKEDMVTVNGKTITGASVIITAVVKNIMECMQTINQANMMHGTKNMDDLCAARDSGNKPSNKAPTLVAAAPPQKQNLALNNKLCNTFCTQAGLSAETADCIWEDAQGFM